MFYFQCKLETIFQPKMPWTWGTENFNSYSLKDHMQKVHVSEFTLAVASFKHPSGVISGQCPVLGAVQRHNWSHNLPPPLTRPRHLTREPGTVMGMLCRTAVTVTVATVMIMVVGKINLFMNKTSFESAAHLSVSASSAWTPSGFSC